MRGALQVKETLAKAVQSILGYTLKILSYTSPHQHRDVIGGIDDDGRI